MILVCESCVTSQITGWTLEAIDKNGNMLDDQQKTQTAAEHLKVIITNKINVQTS